MAIDSLTLVRKRIGDDKKSETESFNISETTATAQLAYSNVGIFNVYDKKKQSSPLTLDTDYTVDSEAGVVTLLYTPETSSVLTVVYYYYAFKDSELQDLIDANGVNGACVEAIRWLLADTARLHDYSRGATSESLSQIYKHLQDMLKDYTAMGGLSAGNEGQVSPGVSVDKRIHNYYRKTQDVPFDLSRDDSLSN